MRRVPAVLVPYEKVTWPPAPGESGIGHGSGRRAPGNASAAVWFEDGLTGRMSSASAPATSAVRDADSGIAGTLVRANERAVLQPTAAVIKDEPDP